MARRRSDLDPYRLPDSVSPRRYDVRLRPDLDAGTFTGTVSIEVDVSGPVAEFVLNAAELEILTCTVDEVDAEWELDPGDERLFIVAPTEIPAGTSVVRIGFEGVLNDLLRGFYRSTYVDEHGHEQVIATTQMQATDCRRAFPCWDEPAFKAVFGITLDVEAGLTAISNAPEVERREGDGRIIIRFADTMVMSSYLVAFVVGRLETTAAVDVDGVPLRVVHVPGKSHLTRFGLDVGAFALRWFQDYYGIPYPGEKIDLVALPDFAAGAMENLGCVTFRESLLLVDPERSTQHEQSTVTDVVSHELAHMWFGDLVTMRWWNGIWLNEAFATFMEVAACDAYRPDWERWTAFAVARTMAFETDSLMSTRSVEYEVRSPADCEGMFDVLTYEKGGALLRMLEQYLGPDRFREGVAHYLRRHSYQNTETNDLWDAIEETSGAAVRAMMDSWIWQPGFPLVEATHVDGPDGAMLRLAQRRFRFEGGAAVDEITADDTDGTAAAWIVPVHVRRGATTSIHLLAADGGAVLVPLDGADGSDEASGAGGAIVVNAGGHGFFRVAYDTTLRAAITGEALSTMSTLERYNLVDDSWSATLAGRLSATELLAFLEGFAGERDHAVWQAIVIALRGLGRLVDGAALDAFRSRVRTLVSPALRDLGEPSPDDDDLTAKLRGLLTSVLGTLGSDAEVQQRCLEMFDAAGSDPAAVEPELLAAATTVVASNGDERTYERIVAGYTDAETPQDQLRHLYALAEFDDVALLRRTCDFAMSGAVKTQNAPFLLRRAITNRDHGPVAWDFVKQHWTDANERFPTNTIVRMVDSVQLLNTPDLVADVQSFLADHPIEQAIKTQEQILERQRVNAALRARDEAELSALLTR